MLIGDHGRFLMRVLGPLLIFRPRPSTVKVWNNGVSRSPIPASSTASTAIIAYPNCVFVSAATRSTFLPMAERMPAIDDADEQFRRYADGLEKPSGNPAVPTD